jgi:hypothetical protein
VRLYDLYPRKAGKPALVEGQNSSKPMHLHGGDETGVVPGFPETA